ncbi:hypothetical protein SF12_03475, partial [Streptomyces sp. MBRL 601]
MVRGLPGAGGVCLEDVGDVAAALLHADQAEAEVDDEVAHQVAGLVVGLLQEQAVAGAGEDTARAGRDAPLAQ